MSAEDPHEVLDGLLPGLGNALVDLLDAISDRTDDLDATAPQLLDRLAGQLNQFWARTPTTERPLLVLDALRVAVTSPRP